MSGKKIATVADERRATARGAASASASRANERPRLPGINVIGYLRTETGVGEAARTIVGALRHAGHPVSCTSISSPDGARESDRSIRAIEAGALHDISLFCVNASETDTVYRALGPAFFTGRHNIGLWFWELAAFPASEPALSFFDEIWTSSRFVQRAVSDVAQVPVINIGLPVTAPAAPGAAALAALGLPRDRQIFLYAFDALSVVERKNPMAVIRAFELAFGRSSQLAHLVIKASRLELFPDEHAALRDAVASVGGRLIDHYLDRPALNALFHACDVYVSLHRSEGFGLTLAEAMAIGKPVVATAYSGNMDFMSVGNSAPVEYTMTRLGRTLGPYQKGACWAEPDVHHAAGHMARLAHDREEAARMGRRAATDIVATHGMDVVGQLLSARVQRIHETHRLRRSTS
jgi:glycosyltransferase involved in cell wall biosynthesis